VPDDARLLDHDTLELLRGRHPAWRLLRAEHAPLILSFLHRVFVLPNARAIAQPELMSRLDDHLFELRERRGEGVYPRPAVEYLDAWASDDAGYLRKYYAAGGGDEPTFDLTPASEKAIEWVTGLSRRPFVATESRLLTVFDLLRQIVEGTEQDRDARLADLRGRRDQIDGEIQRLEAGDFTLMDAAAVKDRFLQLASTARALLSDFREVEQNFRELDRGVRERIALWQGSKGELLEDIFGERDAIGDSDQGRSFRAFWDFLMSPSRQEELTSLLGRVLALPAVRTLSPEARLGRVHYDWLDAGEVAQRTVARLSEQLRRFLDDQLFLENKRILTLIREIEQSALALRSEPPGGPFAEIEDNAASIELPMDKPLFVPPWKPVVDSGGVDVGEASISADALYEQVYVDRVRLAENVRRSLETFGQAALAAIVDAHPLENGLAELVAYLAIASEDRRHVIDDQRRQTIQWIDSQGVARQATLPLVIFHR
jgi:hypothetical protein